MSATQSTLVKALGFPRTRRALAGLVLHGKSVEPLVLRVLFWWGASFVLLTMHALLRGMMDDLGSPVQGAEWETGVFGSVPTVWLQENIWPLAPGVLKWLAVIIHASWFVVPMLAAAFVSFRRPERVGSLFRWWVLLELAVLPLFAIFPMRPPWMDEPGVTRIIALVFGDRVTDSNPVAAMPSMHVAFPLVIGLWLTRERWCTPAALMIGYSGLVSCEVVFSGEHYVIDVIAAAVVSILVACLARLDYQAICAKVARVLLTGRRLVLQPVPSSRGLHHGERGQTLVEFAFALPILLVLLLVLVDFGLALDRRQMAQHAVREGARAGAVGASVAEIQETAAGPLGVDPTRVEVCYVNVRGDAYPGEAGDDVRVSGNFAYRFTAGGGEMLSAFGLPPPQITMTPSAQMRLERNVPIAVECP